MPTIVRFLTVLVILAGLFAVAVFYLGNFVEPNTREMSVRIPSSRLSPRPIAPMPEPSPPAPAVAADPDADAPTGTVAR